MLKGLGGLGGLGDMANLMKQAQGASKQADLKFEYKGSGETAFLKSIDGVENEGGGAEKKNWQFWVNGKRADRGFGVFELQLSDKVVWKFVPFEMTR